MSNASSKKETLEILQKRKKLITAFINNRSSSDDAVVNERQKDKKECAMYYLEELEEVLSIVNYSKEDSSFYFVSDESFDKCETYLDFCTIVFDGIYFQIKIVNSLTAEGITSSFFIYAFPISKVLL